MQSVQRRQAHIRPRPAFSIEARAVRPRKTFGDDVVDWPSTACRTMGANGLLALIAILALGLGVLVYMLDRPQASVYFLPQALSFAEGHRPYFGALGGQIPDFVHVYAFILLTVALSAPSARLTSICAFWWLVDTLFKFGEHPTLAPRIAAAVPEWFQHVPVLENTAGYFLRGTFDPLDLAAIALGTIAASLTVRSIRQNKPREKAHASPK